MVCRHVLAQVNAEFNYLPRNKAQMGWRSWGRSVACLFRV